MSVQDGSRIQTGREEFDPRPLRPQPLRPAASPVDTFSAPNAGAGMEQLAQSLSGIAPDLRRFSGIMAQKEQAGAEEQATTAASKAHENRLAYADAVKKGIIQPNDNPWFRFYFEQQSGALAAGDYAQALEGEMKTNPAWAESTNPEDFGKLEGQFRQNWVKTHVADRAQNPHFAATFQKIMDGVSQDAGRQFAAQAGARMQLRAGDQLNQLLNQTIDRSYQKHEGRDMLVQQLNAIQDRYIKDNPNGGKIANLAAVRAIQGYALLHPEQAEEILGLGKDIRAGSGPLSTVQEYRDMEADTRNKVLVQQSEAQRTQDEKEQHEDRVGEKSLWSDLVTAITKAGDPQTVDVTPFIQRAHAFGNSDQIVERIMGLRQAFAQRNAFGNENTFQRAMLGVYGLDPENPGHLTNMSQLAGMLQLDPGLRISTSQFSQLAEKIQERDKAGAEGRAMREMNILNNPAFVQGRNLLHDFIVDPAAPTQAQAANYGLAIETFTAAYLQHLPELDAAKGPEELERIIKGLVHDAAQQYAPDMAKAQIAESEQQAIENKRQHGVFQQVIASIKTPEDRRAVNRLEAEVQDLSQHPLDAQKNRRHLSDASMQFLFVHGMGNLYKPGTKLTLDDINNFLSEYRQSTTQR